MSISDLVSYSSSSDSWEKPKQAHISVQLSADLKLCGGVCPPHGIPVDWRKRWGKQIKDKKKQDFLDMRWRETPGLLVMSTSAMARGAKLGEVNALKLPVSTLVTRFPLYSLL